LSAGEISIRKAASSDVESIWRLLADLGYGDQTLSTFEETFRTVSLNSAISVLVAEAGDRIVGLASTSHRPQLRLGGLLVSLDEFVVAAEYRGCGVGRLLLEGVKAHARALKACRLELETNRVRESYKRGFYVKNGFTEVNSAVLRIDREELEA
jgi:N-acetylglutamate synthase-like GNAT family acetyltransferase